MRTRVIGLFLALVAALGASLVVGATANAATVTIDEVATSLRANPVYADPTAQNPISQSEAVSLRNQINSGGVPIYIAVLPQSVADNVGGSADAVLVQLKDAVARNGVYAVIVGNAFRAGSTDTRYPVRDLATSVFNQYKADGPYAVLTNFTAQTIDMVKGGGGGGVAPAKTGPSGWFVLGVLIIIGCIAALVIFFLVRKAKADRLRRVAEIRVAIDEDVTALGEKLSTVDVNDPALTDEARADLTTALDCYSRAGSAASAMTRESDAVQVTTALEEGRYAYACVEARREGKPLPERRPPCFADPRHGPSEQDVQWSPDGGPVRAVPLCAVCVDDLAAGRLPVARTVASNGVEMPYWQSPAYGGYARGYYSGFGDIVPMLFMGTMISSMMGPHITYIDSNVNQAGFGGGSFGGDGGFGGGGGDFGGGGFGGGDFGGGGGEF